MTDKKQHLFLFTIGPVQSFIAQARKTQDLYAGSTILSELIQTAVEKVRNVHNDNKIIFPYTEGVAIPSYPNRFVALINSDDSKGLGDLIERTVQEKWMTLSQNIIMKAILKGGESVKFDFSGINQQLEQQLEVFWVFEPYIEDKYDEVYKRLERNLGVIKNVRTIQQFNYRGVGEKGRKCSLDGERNAFFFGKGTTTYLDEKWNPFAIELKHVRKSKVGQNEGLSAVSFVKRFYPADSFPSTSKIALLNLFNDNEIANMISRYKEYFFENSFDDQLLFDDNLNDSYLKKYDISYNEDKYDDIKEAQKTIFRKAKDKNIRVSKYYAMIRFDGDSMGKWLSEAKSDEQHSDFSKLLLDFSEKAKHILDGTDKVVYQKEGKVENVSKLHRGQAVYAGGDDFLGLVNLEYLFETLNHFKDMFEYEVTLKAKQIFNTEKKFTMSMSVLIGHYKMPLQKAITYSETLLKDTKQYFKKPTNDYDTPKNGIGICYMTSNSVLGTSFLKRKEDLILLKDLSQYFDEGSISPSLLFKYFQSIKSIVGTELSLEEYESQVAMLQIELKRLLERTCSKDKKETIIQKLITNSNNLNETGLASFLRYQAKRINSNKYCIDTDNFFSFIKIATKIAQ